MSADGQRKAYRYTCNMIRPQIYSEKSLMESVVDFFSDVVPQAYSSTQKVEDKEKIQWVRFENCDCNDISKNPDLYRSDTKGLPLLLILGYSNGVQIWHVTSNGEAQELMSIRQGPVRIFRVLPNPDPALGYPDAFVNKRPLAVMCDSSSAGQPYCGIKFVSLKTGDEVHSVSYKTLPVQTIECNKRFLVIVFLEKICVYETCQFKQLFWVTSCYPCPGPTVNPVALSSRWLGYADKRLVAMHQSCGGMSGDGSQSYAATVISAAKGAFKGMSMFGEAIVNSVTGCKTPGMKKQEVVHLDNGNRPGIVTVVDIQNVHNDHFNVNEDNKGSGLIAHFHAHANEPVSNMAFDSTGTLLVTACKLGHNFHVFRLMAHPCTSSLGAVHHLYTLHRGDTTAKVIDISFNHDSRWVTVSTHRGTTHIFPITPYGGPINVRTHCQPHIVNRASRFHKSAGLEDIERSPVGRRSPVLSTSPGSSGQYDRYPTLIQQNTLNNNMGNPRLPPYPHPTTVYPLFQIKQPLNVVLNPSNKNQSPSHSPTGLDNMYCVCAKFCSPRLCVIGSPKLDVDRRESGRRPVDSLYIMTQSGTLVEYILEPKARAVLDKVTEDCTLDLAVSGRMQWNLQRLKASQELRPPLPSNSPLILANEAVMSQIPTAADLCDHIGLTRQDSKDSLSSEHSNKDDDEQWLSQVEIITHAGPHRRLWMGPQFSFKTYQENTTVLSSSSSALLSQSPESNIGAMDITGDEGDLESLKVQPTRSNPVTMPTTRPAYRRLSGSDSSPSPGLGQITPLMIEAGSFDQSPHLLDVYSNWTESTVEKQPRGNDDIEEDRLKQTLADAMVESPIKDIEKLSLRQDITRTSVRNGKKKDKAQVVTDRKKQLEKTQKREVEPAATGSKSVSNRESVKTVEEQKSAKPGLSEGSKKAPIQKDVKGKTRETSRKQESKEACIDEKQESSPVIDKTKTSNKRESCITDAVAQTAAKASSRKAVLDKDEALSKEEPLTEDSKRANGKKGKQDSGKKSKTSKTEKTKVVEVRFAPEEEIITEKVSRKERESSGLVSEKSVSDVKSQESKRTESSEKEDICTSRSTFVQKKLEHAAAEEENISEKVTSKKKDGSNLETGTSISTKKQPQKSASRESIEKEDNSTLKSKTVQKNAKRVVGEEEITTEKASSKEKEGCGLEETSIFDKKTSKKSNSHEAIGKEDKSTSRSKSVRKTLTESCIESNDVYPKAETGKKEKDASTRKEKEEVSILKTTDTEMFTCDKSSKKYNSNEAYEKEGKPTSRSKSARKNLEQSFVEPVDGELEVQAAEEEKETNFREDEVEASKLKTSDQPSYGLRQDDLSNASKQKTDSDESLQQNIIEVEMSESMVTRPEDIEYQPHNSVSSKLDFSETDTSTTTSVSKSDTAESSVELPQQSWPKKEDVPSAKEKKKKRKNGKKTQDRLNSEEQTDIQDKKNEEIKEECVKLDDVQDQVKGNNTPAQNGRKTDKKQFDKEETDSKKNKCNERKVSQQKQNKQTTEVFDSEALVLATANISFEETLKSGMKETARTDDVVNDKTGVKIARTVFQEMPEIKDDISKCQTVDVEFPRLPEKVDDDNEGMFVVKSKRSRKKKSKMEESEYFDTTESLKDLEIDSFSEKTELGTNISSSSGMSSSENKPDTNAQDANEELEKQATLEVKLGESVEGRERNAEPVVHEDKIFIVKGKRKKKKKQNMMEDSVYEMKQDEKLVQDNEKSIYLEATGLTASSLTDNTYPTDKTYEIPPSSRHESDKEADAATILKTVTGQTILTEEPESSGSDDKGVVSGQDNNEQIEQNIQDLNETRSNFEPSSWETAAMDNVDKDLSKETLKGSSSLDEEIVNGDEEACAAGGIDNSADVPLSSSSDRSSEEREGGAKVATNSDRSSEERDTTAKAQLQKSDSKSRKKKRKNKK